MRALATLLGVACVLALSSCAIGSRDPGCARDGDCEAGFVCRAGACMRFTTPITHGGGSGGSAGAPGAAGGAGGR